MNLTFNCNLRQLTLHFIALSYWEQEDVKDKVVEIFKNHFTVLMQRHITPHDVAGDVLLEWNHLTKKIIKKLESNTEILTEELKTELTLTAKRMGYEIFKLFLNISNDLRYIVPAEGAEFIKNIRWKNNSTVDLMKTYQAVWGKKSKIFTNPLNLTDVLDEFKKHYWTYGIRALEYYISLCEEFYHNEDLPDLIQKIGSEMRTPYMETPGESHNVTMLRFFAKNGFPNAFKCYWNMLTDNQKKHHVVRCTMLGVSQCAIKSKTLIYYGKLDQYLEICLFLLHQMSNDEKTELFHDNNELWLSYFPTRSDFKLNFLKMLLNWPWERFFLPVLELIWTHNSDERRTIEYLKLIALEMRSLVNNDSHFFNGIEHSTYSNIFLKTWEKIPIHTKRLLTESEIVSLHSLLVEAKDTPNVALIMHDPNITTDGKKIAAVERLTDLVMINDFKLFDEYIKVLTSLPDERKNLKLFVKIQNIIEKIIPGWQKTKKAPQTELFTLLDQILDWQSDSSEEREHLKRQIDIKFVYLLCCRTLIGHQFFQQFLNWYFNSEEEAREYIKGSLRTCEETWNIVLDYLLMKDTLIGDFVLDQFLTWLFESEDKKIIEYREMISLNEEFLMQSLGSRLEENITSYKMFHRVFEWCLFSREMITEFKKIFFEKIVIHICTLKMKTGKLIGINEIIDWALESESEAKESYERICDNAKTFK